AYLASSNFEVGRVRLEQLSGDRPNPRLEPLRAFEDRGPGRDHAARRERADAIRDQRRIAGAEHDLLRHQAEGVGHDLGHRGLEPLPMWRAAGEDDHPALGIELDLTAFEGTDSSGLDVRA